MIVTKKFVFLHLPRSGGTFVSEVIKKFFPEAREIGRHMPRTLLPEDYSKLPILCTVRNPWDYYVSLYHYAFAKDPSSILVSWMTDNGTLDFADSVRNLLELGVNQNRLDRLIDMLPDEIDYSRTIIPNITKSEARKARDSGLGYYSFRFHQMFGNFEDLYFCKVESLRGGLISFLDSINSATDEIKAFVMQTEKRNMSDHLHYSQYYTEELANLVELRDHQVIKRFGYTQPACVLARTNN